MTEIQPVSATYPVVKPDKINKHDKSPKKHPQEKKQLPDEQNPQPSTHIDVLV